MADPIYTDSLFVRNHPSTENLSGTRTHGEHYYYNNALNKQERIEMTYRSIGRQFDWDMEKYRSANKHIDRANKRRMFKNFARFMKNPIGYTWWKVYVKRSPQTLFALTFFAAFAVSWNMYKKVERSRELKTEFFSRHGFEMHGDGSQRYGLRNSQALIPHMPFAVLQYSYGGVDSVIASPVNSQAHRKHFDLRRTYGLNSN